MIVTLTPNPALDLTYHLDAVRLGESHRVAPAHVRAGGKGVNVGRVLHARGHRVRLVATVGGASGDVFRADLDAARLPHRLLDVQAPTRSTVAVVTPTSTTNLNETGAALTRRDWDALVALVAETLAYAGADGTPVLVCSGSLPPATPPDTVARLVTAARDAGAACVVDTSGPHLLAAADAGADVLKPNLRELRGVTGADLDGEGLDGVTAAARRLARRSGGLVYASLGADGLLRVPATGAVLHARLDRVLVGNTTGAGDAAVAAIAADLDRGVDDAVRTVTTATAWSAAAVLHPLAGAIADPEPLLTAVTTTPIPTEA